MAMKIEKNQVHSLIYTATHRLEGIYFKMPDARLLDDLNARKDFIPLSQAKISNLLNEQQILLEADMVIINKHRIAFFVPDPKTPRK